MKAIYFDMDGTIANLYGVENWEARLNSCDPTIYEEAGTCFNLVNFVDLLAMVKKVCGVHIGVATWTAKNGDAKYNRNVRKQKINWLKKNFPVVDEVRAMKYGTKKYSRCDIKDDSILIDDNPKCRQEWENDSKNRIAIDPTNREEFMKFVSSLLNLIAASLNM